jgi:hypothetical protein
MTARWRPLHPPGYTLTVSLPDLKWRGLQRVPLRVTNPVTVTLHLDTRQLVISSGRATHPYPGFAEHQNLFATAK